MHRMSKNGSYRIDRVFGSVGRIACASGARTATEFRKRNALLTRLYDQGRLDLLRAIRAGTFSVTEVFAADREQKLDTLTGDRASLVGPLWPAVEAWLGPKVKRGPTRRRYGVSFDALKARAGLPETATVEMLVAVDWVRLKAEWPRSAADWNHLRRCVSAFLSVTLGDPLHTFRVKLLRKDPKTGAYLFPWAKETPRVPDLTVEVFWQIVHAAPEHVRAAFVTIAALGLRIGEYLRLTHAHLLPHTCAVNVPGTKTAGSADVVRVDERLWPWIVAGVPAPVQYKWLRLYWKRALKAAGADPGLRLHDLRHSYGQWLADAGVPESRIQTGLRHATAAMTRRYTKQRDKGENARTMADVLLATA